MENAVKGIFHPRARHLVQISNSVSEYQIKINLPVGRLIFIGDSNEIWTRVLALRGPCPRPLDDGTDLKGIQSPNLFNF